MRILQNYEIKDEHCDCCDSIIGKKVILSILIDVPEYIYYLDIEGDPKNRKTVINPAHKALITEEFNDKHLEEFPILKDLNL